MQKKNSDKSVRLSKNIAPQKYDIELKPDLENFTFSGIETITLSVLKKTNKITLHSKEIEIGTVRAGEVFGDISYSKKQDTATFTFPKFIPAGKAKLTLVFKGILMIKCADFTGANMNPVGRFTT